MAHSSNQMFLLGADDPEMRAISQVLTEHCASWMYATKNGERVQAGDAYHADPIDAIREVVLVECGTVDHPKSDIDHHRPGDPGDKPPEFYWEASSLGQIAAQLAVEPTPEMRTLAAMDHCFPAAMKGQCPGVEPEEVLDLKLDAIAETHGVCKDVVSKTVENYMDDISAAESVYIGNERVNDLRHLDLGRGYSLDYLALQVGLVIARETGLIQSCNTQDGRRLISLAGGAAPQQIIDFKERWAPLNGLSNVFGIPNRGIGGGYLA